ncbi:uncharacterized protein LOC129905181 [Episyrphus balteatus]|uniref:uncharacterized protein LOC129905181 n=1 Tax=Episyrphus balteatus TaxID=286459 RepID=UPI002485E55B|nr:uncharacterized protein LOC129905181 [Episyrphus balteatus]
MNVCGNCKDELPYDGDFAVCSTCNNKLHFECTTVSEKSWRTMGKTKKDLWRCQLCRNNSIDPQGISATKGNTLTVSQQNTPNSPEIVPQNPYINNTTVLEEIRLLRDQMKEITASNDFLGTKFDEINVNIKKNNNLIEDFTKEINELKESNKKKDEIIENMQSQINNMEQQMIRNNVDIKNIPPTANENLIEIVKGIGKTINCEIKDNDLTDIYRTKPRNPENSVIIASFSSNIRKTHFVKQARATRPIKLNAVMQNVNKELSSGSAASSSFDNTVYINNQLTRQNKHILWLTKEKAKQVNWRFVWESAGKILARKNESTQPIIISTANDVNKLTST